MKIHRMTFDVAVGYGGPDVYTLESEIIKEIRNVPFVIGAEGIGKNGLMVKSIDASAAIDKQMKEDCLIELKPFVKESEVHDGK